MPESTQTQSQPPRAPLPPGMVLGPDGKPCRACSSSAAFRNWKPALDAREQARRKTSTAAAAAIVGAAAGSESDSTSPPHPCPPNSNELGSATWTFLHTTAAYYPSRPTPSQRANMLSLLYSLPLLYPCSHCASDFGEDIAKHKPDVSGREGLSKWLCERHNEVNRKLGKSVWECKIGELDERWKDGPGDGRCD